MENGIINYQDASCCYNCNSGVVDDNELRCLAHNKVVIGTKWCPCFYPKKEGQVVKDRWAYLNGMKLNRDVYRTLVDGVACNKCHRVTGSKQLETLVDERELHRHDCFYRR